MIDFDDADDFLTMGIFSPGGLAVILIIVAVILFFVANSNEKECKQMTCEVGQQARLLDNQCLCVSKPSN